MSILSVEHLAKSFGAVHAVDRVSFAVEESELLAMIGPNGAGKTTCFNLINGQLQPDAGEVLFESKPIQGLAPWQRCRLGIGRTFQVAATFGSMTARENVQLAQLFREGKQVSLLSALDKSSIENARATLELVGMAEQAERPCAELAYGDLKRVELGIALAARPRLLLMDEPTAGMATAERHALMRLVSGIARAQGISVLFTEHDMDVVFGYADRIVVLDDGALIAQGTPAQIRADARVRSVYLGEEAADA